MLAFINLALFGVFASVYFLKRGSIWGVGAFHSVWNLVQGNVYGIKVSGIETGCSLFSVTALLYIHPGKDNGAVEIPPASDTLHNPVAK